MSSHPSHMLIFEPRADGHHLSWLRLISAGFLSIGMRVTLALDDRPEAMARIRTELGTVMEQVEILPVFDRNGRYREKSKLRTMALCQRESGAGELFLPNLDEIASGFLRRAAVGISERRSRCTTTCASGSASSTRSRRAIGTGSPRAPTPIACGSTIAGLERIDPDTSTWTSSGWR